MDWSFVHKAWDKWASLSIGSSGKQFRASQFATKIHVVFKILVLFSSFWKSL